MNCGLPGTPAITPWQLEQPHGRHGVCAAEILAHIQAHHRYEGDNKDGAGGGPCNTNQLDLHGLK